VSDKSVFIREEEQEARQFLADAATGRVQFESDERLADKYRTFIKHNEATLRSVFDMMRENETDAVLQGERAEARRAELSVMLQSSLHLQESLKEGLVKCEARIQRKQEQHRAEREERILNSTRWATWAAAAAAGAAALPMLRDFLVWLFRLWQR
jgi:hypothetical protein